MKLFIHLACMFLFKFKSEDFHDSSKFDRVYVGLPLRDNLSNKIEIIEIGLGGKEKKISTNLFDSLPVLKMKCVRLVCQESNIKLNV